MPSELPYANLTPDVVLESVESVGFRCDGRIIALNSYENRVYQLGTEDGGFVVAKFCSKCYPLNTIYYDIRFK